MDSSKSDVKLDWRRTAQTGLPEVVLGQSKSIDQLLSIVDSCIAEKRMIFMTRIASDKADALIERFADKIYYHVESRTLSVGITTQTDANSESDDVAQVAIVSAGTSDTPVVAEIEQTLRYLGVSSDRYIDVGVAGLWRLTDIAEQLNQYPVIVAVAGMEGALFSVLAGLVKAPVVAVPSSVGYGVSAGGHIALHSALSSCSPGLAVVNIDNGFGAAALAVKILNASGACDVSL
ncbi:MAG: nickel pincer cofactor biosynthesis protein LarB [Granulosicoccus sp.]